jgi:V/A-type H+-transporting ATPase subunit E
MPLSDLLAGLRAEAVAEAAQLEAETEAEVTRIDAEAQSEARRLREDALRAVEEEVCREADAVRARARLAAAGVVRQARDDTFRACLAEVRRRLEAVRRDSTYPAVLEALLRESLAAMPTATVLRVDPRDEGTAAALVAELGVDLEIEASLQTAGGVELARGDARVVRNTVEERLANAEPALSLVLGRSYEGPTP